MCRRCSFHFRHMTNNEDRVYFESLVRQKRLSLIYLQFCEYFLWVKTIDVNFSFKRVQGFKGKLDIC